MSEMIIDTIIHLHNYVYLIIHAYFFFLSVNDFSNKNKNKNKQNKTKQNKKKQVYFLGQRYKQELCVLERISGPNVRIIIFFTSLLVMIGRDPQSFMFEANMPQGSVTFVVSHTV